MAQSQAEPSAIMSPLAFHPGVRRMKYERMLAEQRDVLEGMTVRELDGYLHVLERRYRERATELAPSVAQSLGATDELRSSDVGRWLQIVSQAERQARETALEEVLQA